MCTHCVREPNDNIFFGIDLKKYQCDTWYLYAFDSVLAHSSGDNELKYCLYRTENQILCYTLNIYFENLNVHWKVNCHPDKNS